MSYKHIEVKPIAGAMGAEIAGVDLSQTLSDEAFQEIHDAFMRHLMIFFRNQDLNPETEIAFARRFGPLIVDPYVKAHDKYPEMLVIVKEAHEKNAFGESWHSDSTFLERPPAVSFLHAKEVPEVGGNTMFANQYLAYETLSDGLKADLLKLRALHNTSRSYTKAYQTNKYATRAMQLRDDDVIKEAMTKHVIHPAVRTHPVTGRKALYVNKTYVINFDGWTEEESLPLVRYLCAHAVRPEFTCELRWEPGTLAMWDNRCAMHHPINNYHGVRREMHRVVAEGDRPV